MRAVIELPEAVYRKSAEAARRQGVSLDALIVDLIARALERELASAPRPSATGKRMERPLVPSDSPGTMDLSDFDFDSLLA